MSSKAITKKDMALLVENASEMFDFFANASH